MKTELLQVAAGSLSFDSFAIKTASRWKKLARMLMRRWCAPSSVSEEDIEQELLLGAWQAIPRWQSGRQSIERFVVWQATNEAKRWLLRQRGSKNPSNGDKDPARFDMVAEGDEPVDAEVVAAQESVVLALERLGFATRVLRARQRKMVDAWMVTGSVDGAVAHLAAQGLQVPRRTVNETMRHVVARIESMK